MVLICQSLLHVYNYSVFKCEENFVHNSAFYWNINTSVLEGCNKTSRKRPINYTKLCQASNEVNSSLSENISRTSQKEMQALLINGELFYSWVVIASLKLELHFQPYYMKDNKTMFQSSKLTWGIGTSFDKLMMMDTVYMMRQFIELQWWLMQYFLIMLH